MKKLASLFTAAAVSLTCLAGLSLNAGAAGVEDLSAISSDCTYIAQNETTAGLTRDTLSWDGRLLTLNGDNAYSTSKGYSVFNGEQVQNLLQVKQGRNMVIKVAAPCTVDVYHDDNSGRIIQAGTVNKGTDIEVTQAVYENGSKNYDIDTFSITEASSEHPVTVYIGASGDVYVAAIDVKVEAAQATTAPVSTDEPDAAAKIVSAVKADGNTAVKLENVTDGVLIGVKRDSGVLQAVKTAEITGSDMTLEGIEADMIYVWDSLDGMAPVCAAKAAEAAAPATEAPTEAVTAAPIEGEVVIDFTVMSEVPVYSAASGQGFTEYSDAIMPEAYRRQAAPAERIELSSEGAKVTESDGAYLHYTNSNSYNYGGLIYRVDTGRAGAYHLEVEVTGISADTRVAPTGMDSSRLTGTSNWDNANMVPRTVSARWSGNTWSYDFATGEKFVEIEVEPSALPSASAPKTVGIRSIKLIPLEVNAAGEKPTIHILGDSTQKTYTFNETISSWGQTLANYFDTDKVNVINYSMGGRAMKSNYNEGRFDEILIRGKVGDFVFIHSAHNDETVSNDRFERGAATISGGLEANNENYNRWLDMYVEAIKARGMTPVLVTSMPRINSATGTYSESAAKPNGFDPDAPGNMRAKAAQDSSVGLIELYDGAKAYLSSLDGKEVSYIYNSVEAGETPAENSANGANGDGTHYRESAAKQFCRIMLQSIYDQANSDEDTYTDKAVMEELVSYMPVNVREAAQSGDWSEVFPEMASDVSAVGVVPDAEKQAESNFYYRTSIEKALQLGLLHKDTENLFKPMQTITVGEFARGIEKAFGLEENVLTSYTRTYAELAADDTLQPAAAEPADSGAEITVADDETAGEGDLAVTVTQPEGGTVTVYNESAYKTETADMTAGLTAESVISDNDYFTLAFALTGTASFGSGSDNNGVFAANGGISTGYVETHSSGKRLVYTSKANGTVTMYLRFVNSKYVICENITDGTKVQVYVNHETAAGDGSNVYGTVTFNIDEGKTYELYSNGGTSRVFGIMYASNNYPQSTSQLNVNAGDTVRVMAAPAESYINGSILINGEAVTTKKEYTFTVDADTSVSASFIAEPKLVETTIIASDAALTREAMGAILYDAYCLADKTNIAQYIAQNGGIPSPDDPNYDPNIQYEGTPYIPLTGWGALEDTNALSDTLFAKVKAAYNLGLIRPETGIARGSIALGTMLEPAAEVTRAKAAKSLVFCFILTQPLKGESQIVPEGFDLAEPSEITAPNPEAQNTVFTNSAR